MLFSVRHQKSVLFINKFYINRHKTHLEYFILVVAILIFKNHRQTICTEINDNNMFTYLLSWYLVSMSLTELVGFTVSNFKILNDLWLKDRNLNCL